MNTSYFKIEHRVNSEEIDELGHVSNIVYVQWLELVIRLHNEKIGLSQSFLINNNSVFIIYKNSLTYKIPAFENDFLEIQTRITYCNAIKHLRESRVLNKKNDKLIFCAETVLACVSYSSGKLKKIPNEYLKQLKNQ